MISRKRFLLSITFVILCVIGCTSISQSKLTRKHPGVFFKLSGLDSIGLFSNNSVAHKTIIDFIKLDKRVRKGLAYKLLISKRLFKTRVTLFSMSNMQELNDDPPIGYMLIDQQLILVYSGLEKFVEIDTSQLYQLIKKYQFSSELKNSLYDPRVLQFDIDSKNQIHFNQPPIDPYENVRLGDSLKFTAHKPF